MRSFAAGSSAIGRGARLSINLWLPAFSQIDRLGDALRESSAPRDRPLLYGAAVAILANLAMYGYVWSAQASLPELMPLHYNGVGVVDLIGRPLELFKLPLIGTVILGVNALVGWIAHRAERPAAHLLVWTALAAQLVFGSGAWILVQKAAGE